MQGTSASTISTTTSTTTSATTTSSSKTSTKTKAKTQPTVQYTNKARATSNISKIVASDQPQPPKSNITFTGITESVRASSVTIQFEPLEVEENQEEEDVPLLIRCCCWDLTKRQDEICSGIWQAIPASFTVVLMVVGIIFYAYGNGSSNGGNSTLTNTSNVSGVPTLAPTNAPTSDGVVINQALLNLFVLVGLGCSAFWVVYKGIGKICGRLNDEG